jgi:hypothetical protein
MRKRRLGSNLAVLDLISERFPDCSTETQAWPATIHSLQANWW